MGSTASPSAAVTYGRSAGDGSSHPWVVAIRDPNGALVCTGSLIGRQVVLTAAHCIDGKPKNVLVHSGAAAGVAVDGYATHPSYDRSAYRNDIGLLHLARPLTAAPAALGPVDDTALMRREGESLRVLGWGRTESGTVQNLLRWATQRDISGKGKDVLGNGFEPDRMIAAGRWDAKLRKYSGACQGDSGGPLTTSGRSPVVVGIVSFGATRCSSNLPTVYTRVAAYRSWIMATMKTLGPTAAGVVDVTVVGGNGTITASVTGAGSRRLELRCEKPGTTPVVAVLAEGASRLAPVPAGTWRCSARPAYTDNTFSPIGPVVVR